MMGGLVAKIVPVLGIVAVLGAAFLHYQNVKSERDQYRLEAQQLRDAHAEQLSENSRLRAQADQARADQERIEQARQETIAQLEKRIAENDARRATIIEDAIRQPYISGNRADADLRRWMRALARAGGSNQDGQGSDNLLAGEAPSSGADRALIITITPETAERYEELCADGRDDFCNWAIFGFPAGNWLTFSNYLWRLEAYIEQMNAAYDQCTAAVENLK